MAAHHADWTQKANGAGQTEPADSAEVALLVALCGLMCLQWAFLGPSSQVKVPVLRCCGVGGGQSDFCEDGRKWTLERLRSPRCF